MLQNLHDFILVFAKDNFLSKYCSPFSQPRDLQSCRWALGFDCSALQDVSERYLCLSSTLLYFSISKLQCYLCAVFSSPVIFILHHFVCSNMRSLQNLAASVLVACRREDFQYQYYVDAAHNLKIWIHIFTSQVEPFHRLQLWLRKCWNHLPSIFGWEWRLSGTFGSNQKPCHQPSRSSYFVALIFIHESDRARTNILMGNLSKNVQKSPTFKHHLSREKLPPSGNICTFKLSPSFGHSFEPAKRNLVCLIGSLKQQFQNVSVFPSKMGEWSAKNLHILAQKGNKVRMLL